MLASKIKSYEEKKHKSFSLEELSLNGLKVYKVKKNYSTYYYKEKTEKKRIVLHFTAGYLGGDIATLTKKNYHVSVPYVIARNGNIYQLHDPQYWSYHLGPNAVGGNTKCSKESIGIEISNIGPLEKNKDSLHTSYTDKYCDISESGFYTKKDFRGKKYYASFTDDQYKSLRKLLSYLCKTFKIPNKLLPEKKIFSVFLTASEAINYKGICSHVNYRKDKFDIGPAFKWSSLRSLYFPLKEFSEGEAQKLYSETESSLNYFPIAAYGLWHNGVHIKGKESVPLYALTDGQIVYARVSLEDNQRFGSLNFIVIKHEMTVNDKNIIFYSMYVHLKKLNIKKEILKKDESKIPPWILNKFYNNKLVKNAKGEVQKVYKNKDGSSSLTLYSLSGFKSIEELNIGDQFTVLSESIINNDYIKVKTKKNNEGKIYFNNNSLYIYYTLNHWAMENGKIKKRLFNNPILYEVPCQVSAGEIIGYMGNGLEHVKIINHSRAELHKENIVHFELFSRKCDNEGKDIYKFLDRKPKSYFILEDKDDDIIAEPIKLKKSILNQLNKNMPENFQNYLETIPDAFQTKKRGLFSSPIVLKDEEIKYFMTKYKENFRDVVAKHISYWQALGNKISYDNTKFKNDTTNQELKDSFYLRFKSEKKTMLNDNEQLFFYNPIKFIQILSDIQSNNNDNYDIFDKTSNNSYLAKGNLIVYVRWEIENGQLILGSSVEIEGPDIKKKVNAKEGKVEFNNIPLGKYKVTAKKQSLTPDVATNFIEIVDTNDKIINLTLTCIISKSDKSFLIAKAIDSNIHPKKSQLVDGNELMLGQDILFSNNRTSPGNNYSVSNSEKTLKKKMLELLKIFADGDKTQMAKRLFDRFLSKNKTIGIFEDKDLNKSIENHENFKAFSDFTIAAPGTKGLNPNKIRIHQALQRNNWDINRVSLIKDLGVPAFNLGRKVFLRNKDFDNGLGLMINGVQYVFVYAENYKYDICYNQYEIKLKFILYDVFGLDDDDLLEFGAKSDWGTKAAQGITAWWQLQHQFNYAPLITKAVVCKKYSVSTK